MLCGSCLESIDGSRQTDPPQEYEVVFHNDSETEADFVVDVLVGIFNMPMAAAKDFMLRVDREGFGVLPPFNLNDAQSRVSQTNQAARGRNQPLVVTYRPVRKATA